MQTTLEREVPAEVRPQVHRMAVTNRWLVAAVVVLLLAVVGLGAYAIGQATAGEGEDVLIVGRDELSARQEQMVDVVAQWWEAAEAADIGALTALMTPDATMSGSTSYAVTVRVDEGSFASLVEQYWTEAEITPKLATLVIGDTVFTAGQYDGYGYQFDYEDLFEFTGSGDPLISSIVVVGAPALQ